MGVLGAIEIKAHSRHLIYYGDPEYRHDYEGDDDMSAHIRCILTNDSLMVPVMNGRAALGTWQGIYLYEHRTSRFNRKIVVTVMGD